MINNPRTFTIEVPALPPAEASPNSRVHWSQKYKANENYSEEVRYAALNVRNQYNGEWTGGRYRQMKAKPAEYDYQSCVMQKARLDLLFVFPEHRTRDEGNLEASFKAGQDALIQANFLPDDAPEYLVRGDIKIEVDKARAPLTVITLTEVA